MSFTRGESSACIQNISSLKQKLTTTETMTSSKNINVLTLNSTRIFHGMNRNVCLHWAMCTHKLNMTGWSFQYLEWLGYSTLEIQALNSKHVTDKKILGLWNLRSSSDNYKFCEKQISWFPKRIQLLRNKMTGLLIIIPAFLCTPVPCEYFLCLAICMVMYWQEIHHPRPNNFVPGEYILSMLL